MSWVVTKGIEVVWTVVGGVAKAVAKRTVVVQTMVLGVTWGALVTVGTFILWTVDTKMLHGVAVKTNSFCSHGYWWAQAGVSRDNLSGILLCGLHNQIPSSAHSSVVQRQIEFLWSS